jgi:hypothetical protein
MDFVDTSSFEELHNGAKELCILKTHYNVILKCITTISELDSDFIKLYLDKAEDWQKKEKPDNLFFNHGEYIHKNGDCYKYLVDELKNRNDSNRALFSTISTDNIYYSYDIPIPSFMILQVGFKNGDINELLVTAYFRALEVKHFLPINLAEIVLIIKNISSAIPQITKLDITIHAFKAYFRDEFSCLERAEIDIIDCIELFNMVLHRDLDQIVRLLHLKKDKFASYVETKGLEVLSKSFDKLNENLGRFEEYNQLKNLLTRSIENMAEFRKIRESSSSYDSVLVGKRHDEIKATLDKVIDVLITMKNRS